MGKIIQLFISCIKWKVKNVKIKLVIKQEGNGPIKRAASEDKAGFRFEISDVNYPDIHVHIAYMVLWILLHRPFGSLWGHCSLKTTLEVTLGLSDLHFICEQCLWLPYIANSLNFPRRGNDPNLLHLPLLRLKIRALRLCCRYRAASNKDIFRHELVWMESKRCQKGIKLKYLWFG